MNIRAWQSSLFLLILVIAGAADVIAGPVEYPKRITPVPVTTDTVPHVQIGVSVDPAIYAELLSRVSGIPGVEIRASIISLPGARGFWISDGVELRRPEAIVRGREFAHVHPDGSLHASLPPDIAVKAVNAGWAVHHPWAGQRPGWDGFVMIYTPQSREELEVVLKLVTQSYQYVTRAS